MLGSFAPTPSKLAMPVILRHSPGTTACTGCPRPAYLITAISTPLYRHVSNIPWLHCGKSGSYARWPGLINRRPISPLPGTGKLGTSLMFRLDNLYCDINTSWNNSKDSLPHFKKIIQRHAHMEDSVPCRPPIPLTPKKWMVCSGFTGRHRPDYASRKCGFIYVFSHLEFQSIEIVYSPYWIYQLLDRV